METKLRVFLLALGAFVLMLLCAAPPRKRKI
jgi:hypothetical protein